MRLFHILSPCNTHIFKTQIAGRCAGAVQKQSGLDYRPGPPPNIGPSVVSNASVIGRRTNIQPQLTPIAKLHYLNVTIEFFTHDYPLPIYSIEFLCHIFLYYVRT